MQYLQCPDLIDREITITDVVGDIVFRREQLANGMIVKGDPQRVKWWDFILTAASDEKFFENLNGNSLEAIEIGVAFRAAVAEAKKSDLEVLPLEDDLARRLKATILARKFDRNIQHNYLKWVKLVDGMTSKDPRVVAADAVMAGNN